MERTKNTISYEDDLYIDETALDVEILEQPKLMFRYSQLLADAEREVERLKEKLDVTYAEVDYDIRSNPSVYGLEKVTEQPVKNAVTMDERYKDVKAELNQAIYEMKVLKGAVRSIEQRKDSLSDLVKLHGQQYFAGPRLPRDIKQEVERRNLSKEMNSKVKIKLRTRDV